MFVSYHGVGDFGSKDIESFYLQSTQNKRIRCAKLDNEDIINIISISND